MKRLLYSVSFVLLLALTVPLFAACGEASGDEVVCIEMSDGGLIYIELLPQYAPKTVSNFEKLVSEGFYNGLIFHRVEAGVLIQGGDPSGTGYYGSDETVKGEFSSNGFTKNTLSHTRGVVSLVSSNDYNSASSQFFICASDLPSLDGDYAAFGRVISGFVTLDRIANCETNGTSPVSSQVMKTVRLVSAEEADNVRRHADVSGER